MFSFRGNIGNSDSLIGLAEAKISAINKLTKNLPLGSKIHINRVQRIAKEFNISEEELVNKLITQEGCYIYRD